MKLRFRAAALAELMQAHGLGVSEFGKMAGIQRTVVGAYLSGTCMPQVATLIKICEAFGVGIGFFFEDESGAAHPVTEPSRGKRKHGT